MSDCIRQGLYHPNCKDSHTTYFEVISTPPSDNKYAADELDDVAENYKAEQKKIYAENFNVIRQIAFNILKSETSFKGGITDKQFKCLLDSSYLDKIVMNWICS